MKANERRLPRREFLQRSALGLGSLVLGSSVGRGIGSPPAEGFHAFDQVPLGHTGLTVSRLCLGTGANGGMRESNHTRMGRPALEALIRGAHERGITLFDLADLYGTHPYLVPALEGIPRDRFQIITKIWFRRGGIPEADRPDADAVVERFLRELRTDYIDLLLLHCVTAPAWNEDLQRQMEIISRLKEKGIVRAHGVSCHSLSALRAAVDEPWVESVHARINPYGMAMDGPVDEVVTVLRQLHAAGKGVVGMKIVGEGRLRDDPGRRAESVRHALHLGCVDVLNVGCESLAEIDDMAAMIAAVPRMG